MGKIMGKGNTVVLKKSSSKHEKERERDVL